jgi:hypothetical protein
LRTDRRVTVSMMASPSAISPATWAVKTGVSAETGDASDTGVLFRPLPGCAPAEDGGLAPCDGPIVGNRPAALPAPISRLAAPFMSGTGPSGSTAMCVVPGEALPEPLAFVVLVAEAAVTAVVSAAAGGVHFAVVVTLAVAVSFTELTEVAFDATAIWASRLTVCLVFSEPMLHEAVPLPLAQPLVNVGFWLDGCVVSATDTSEAGPFWVETCTT